ncbi:MAG: DNA-binding transcriptional regulator GbsR (MarR family) [Planctomycetota bacterium]|jgi:DNA-binding transcriptional regulator GbsR (MarR family)
MSSKPETALAQEFTGLEEGLLEQLQPFETFFKSFGFKRIHGRVWGLLVLAGQSLASKEVVKELGISQGLASTTLNELADWGAIQTSFDTSRRCNLHTPVGNTLSIVATVLRRREQMAFARFHEGMTRTVEIIAAKNGPRDPRLLTLRSILSTCEIADAVMQLVFSSVSNALGDPQSLLSRAIGTALKVGAALPNGSRGENATTAKSTNGTSLESDESSPQGTPHV